jgi:NHLM bacteriocin system ABC transporter peptidase/ATP-binding protein
MAERPQPPARVGRVKTPTVLQMDEGESGVAALASVLGYHRKFVSLEELREACGVSRDGVRPGNLVKAARDYGLNARESPEPLRDLGAAPVPLIASWKNHRFVVVEGVVRGRVYLNDPREGPRVVSADDFDKDFGGQVLTFERGPDFRPGGQPPSLLRSLRRRLVGSGWAMLYVFLASLALAMPGLVAPVLTGVFVDYCLGAGRTDWVGPLLAGMALTAGLLGALTWLQQHYLLRLETKLALTSSYSFFRHVLRLPAEYYSNRYGGEVSARIQINDRVARLLSGTLAANLLNVLMAGFYVALMLCYDTVLTLIGVVSAVLNFLALRYVSRRRRDVSLSLLQENAKLSAASMSGLQAIETLKAAGSESDFFSRWAGYMARVLVASQKMDVYTLYLSAVPPLLTALNLVAVLGIGAERIMEGYLTVGMLVAFQSLMSSFLEPINRLVGLGKTLQEVDGEMKRLDDVLGYPVDPNLSGELIRGLSVAGASSVKLTGGLQLCDVTYGYGRHDPPVLTRFSLTVRPGSRVAIVGASGSGKSTVARLICGLYRPWAGEILLDGKPREHIPRAVVTNSVALVDQDFFLFGGTVREVLTMWDSTITEEALVRAAQDACIHDDIAARPGAYDSMVEEGGANFSGGQRQRLEIARALVIDPTLVILDEATSALDPGTEMRIDENLRRRGCTCVIVAHRLSTIRDCDEIIVLERGQIVQRGTHNTLVKDSRDHYRRLIES